MIREIVQRKMLQPLDLFRLYDADKNLRLDKLEFKKLVNKIIAEDEKQKQLQDNEVDQLFKFFDINDDGVINKIEFLDKMQEKIAPSKRPPNIINYGNRPVSLEKMKYEEKIDSLVLKIKKFLRSFAEINNIFDAFNINKTGYLKLHEFVNFLNVIDPDMREADMFSIFQMLDTDHNDQLSIHEFEALVMARDVPEVELVEKRDGNPVEEFRKSMEELNPEMAALLYVKYHEFKKFNSVVL